MKMRKILCHLSQACVALFLSTAITSYAEQNAIQKIEAIKENENVILKISLKTPLIHPPKNFSLLKPARIIIDLPATINNSGQNRQHINLGELNTVDIVQSLDRSRLVLNLQKIQNFDVQNNNQQLIVRLLSDGCKTR